MFCRKCGMKLNDGETICPQCGQATSRGKLENSTQQDSPQGQSFPPKDQNIYLQGQSPIQAQQTQMQVQQPQVQQSRPQEQPWQGNSQPYQPQQGYPSQQGNPQGQPYQPQQGNPQPYQPQQGYPSQQGNAKGQPYQPNPVQQAEPWLQNWVITHQLDKGHAIGITGCVILFLSIFMTLVYTSGLGEYEKATLQQYFTEVMDRPSLVPVMGICTIAAAVLFFCNKVTPGTAVGIAGAITGLGGLFSAWAYIAETEYAAMMHTGIGGYMVMAGTILVLVPQIRKSSKQNHG